MRTRSGAIALGDLVGRLDVLRVTCSKCERKGQYSVAKLIERHGAEAALPDWKDGITADCPRRAKPGATWDICGAPLPGPQRGPVRERAVSRAYDEEALKPLGPRLEPPPSMVAEVGGARCARNQRGVDFNASRRPLP